MKFKVLWNAEQLQMLFFVGDFNLYTEKTFLLFNCHFYTIEKLLREKE